MDIKSAALATSGAQKIDWAEQAMTTLRIIRERFSEEQPLAGMRLAACMHVTAETGALMRALKAGGADVRLCASNPLTTQDDVAAALAVGDEIPVFAIRGEDTDSYFRHVDAALDHAPHITMDDGCDLVTRLHTRRTELLDAVIGGTEETTTGVTRLRSMVADDALRFPVIAVNDAATKHLFDNRYGTGQSTIDGILRATNRLLAGSCFVVCGYGWCGRGLATRAAGMGARVVVTEVEPIRALEAVMDGYTVLPIAEAARIGDFFCTVAGNKHVIAAEHFAAMRDGAVIANAGHFDVELDLGTLYEIAAERRQLRPSLEELRMRDGRRIYLLAEGRLVNLAAAEGHPADVMDLSFSAQALSAEHLARTAGTLEADVHAVPETIDAAVARLKLESMGVRIDSLTRSQTDYLREWREGT